MASTSLPAGGGPGNPVITDIEAVHVNVTADHALDAVVLEVRDDTGAGFRTFFGVAQTMGIAWRLATAVDRLRLPGATP